MPTEIGSDLFGLLGGIQGLLLGFVIVLVWGNYNSVRIDAAKEKVLPLGFTGRSGIFQILLKPLL